MVLPRRDQVTQYVWYSSDSYQPLSSMDDQVSLVGNKTLSIPPGLFKRFCIHPAWNDDLYHHQDLQPHRRLPLDAVSVQISCATGPYRFSARSTQVTEIVGVTCGGVIKHYNTQLAKDFSLLSALLRLIHWPSTNTLWSKEAHLEDHHEE